MGEKMTQCTFKIKINSKTKFKRTFSPAKKSTLILSYNPINLCRDIDRDSPISSGMLMSIPANKVVMQCGEAEVVWLQLASDASLGYESSLQYTTGSLILRTLQGTAQHSKAIRPPVTSCIHAGKPSDTLKRNPPLTPPPICVQSTVWGTTTNSIYPPPPPLCCSAVSLALRCEWDRRIARHTLPVRQKQLAQASVKTVLTRCRSCHNILSPS